MSLKAYGKYIAVDATAPRLSKLGAHSFSDSEVSLCIYYCKYLAILYSVLLQFLLQLFSVRNCIPSMHGNEGFVVALFLFPIHTESEGEKKIWGLPGEMPSLALADPPRPCPSREHESIVTFNPDIN
jgi:hypothetical protein